MSDQGLEYWESKTNVQSLRPNEFSENDRITHVEGIRDLIDLDAVLVVASANIHVSIFLKFPTVIDNPYDRNV